MRARNAHIGGDPDRALGDVLGEIADALQIVRDADRRDDLAQVDGERLTPRDRQDSLLLDLALKRGRGAGSLLIVGWASLVSKSAQRIHRVGQHFLGDAAHFGDLLAKALKFSVISFDDMVGHVSAPTNQPNRPVI